MKKRALPVLVITVFVSLVVVLAAREFTGRQTATETSIGASALKMTALFRHASSFDVSMKEPRGIAVTTSGNIIVCGSRTVEILSPTGALIHEYVINGTAECVAIDEDGAVYLGMVDHVTVLDTTLDSIRDWTVLDDRSIITSIAISGERVFVADAGARTVWVFDRGGMLTNMISGFVVPSPYFDVATGPAGQVWIVDPGRHSITLFDAEGERSTSFGRYSIAADGFGGCCNPTNIAVRSDGTIVTAEKGVTKMKLFGGNGEFFGFVAGPRDFPNYDADIDLAPGAQGELLILSPRVRQIFVYEKVGAEG